MLSTFSKLFSGSKEESGKTSSGSEHAQQSEGNTAAVQPLDPASPEWLSYYAQVAPPEIGRWVNPKDGSGAIPYERLIENLNTLNIPAFAMKAFSAETAEDRGAPSSLASLGSRHASNASAIPVRQASLKQPRGTSRNVAQRSASEAPSSRVSHDRGQSAFQCAQSNSLGGPEHGHPAGARCRSVSVASGTSPSHQQGQTARLQSNAPSEPPLYIPVTSTTRSYVGPVREVKGLISGVGKTDLSRPGPHSQVPQDYVEVVNSRQTQYHGVPPTFRMQTSGDEDESKTYEAAGLHAPVVAGPPGRKLSQVYGTRMASNGTVHKLPAIFLQPVIDSAESTDKATAASVPDTPAKGVTYKLGQYVWSEEDIKLGTAGKPDPPLDPLVRSICSGAIFPQVVGPEEQEKNTSETQEAGLQASAETADRNVLEESPATALTIEDLGIPSIVELCKKKRAELEKLNDDCVRIRDDTVNTDSLSNKGGRGGVCSARAVPKGSVVFVELPLITADVSANGLWPAFQSLTDEQKALLETLEGSAADLSNVEALTCTIRCKQENKLKSAGAYQDFFGKMKLNAHALTRGRGWALYPRAARIKHSCRPNVTYRNLDGLLVVFALEDIAEGTPITMSYIDQLYMPTEERRKRVMATKRIFCQCMRCTDVCQKERKILCPECRPEKIRFTEEREAQEAAQAARVAAVAPPALPTVPEADQEALEDQRGASANDEASECGTAGESRPSLQSGLSFEGSCNSSDYEGSVEEKSLDCCSSDCVSSSDGEEEAHCQEVEAAVNNAGSHGNEETASNADNSRLETSQDSTTASPSSSETESRVDKVSSKGGKNAKISTMFLSLTSSETMASARNDALTGCNKDNWSSDSEAGQTGSVAGDADDVDPQTEARELYDRLTEAGMPRNYCVYEGEDCWHCYTCQKTFRDEELPTGMERYLVGKFAVLREKFGRPCPMEWSDECGKLLRTVEKVLGAEHWLYAAGQLLLAQLCLGMWVGGLVMDDIFSRAAAHATAFLEFANRSVPEALSTDAAPLLVALLRIQLFSGKGKDFVDTVERHSVLNTIRDGLGKWDEVYTSFASAYLYLKKDADQKDEQPSLAMLQRFAHASQYTSALDAQYYETLEREKLAMVEEVKRTARQREEEARLRAEARQRRIVEVKKNIAALKAAETLVAADGTMLQVTDVTMTHPDGIVQKFLRNNFLCDHDQEAARESRLVKADGTAALASGDGKASFISSAEQAAAAAYEDAKRLQQLAVEGRYSNGVSAIAGVPGSQNGTYLPLLMLADPLQTRAERRHQLRKTMQLLERERKKREQILEALEQGQEEVVASELDFEEDESEVGDTPEPEAEEEEKEQGFIYRVPGLHGTAPGEYVTISQLNHTKDGKYPPLPFFKSFFYIDHEARTLDKRNKDASAVTVIGCGSGGPPPLSFDELEDIEGAKKIYLQKENKDFSEELQARVNYNLAQKTAEAAAALRASQAKRTGKVSSFFWGSNQTEELEEAPRLLAGESLRERQRNDTAALLEATNEAVREMALHEADTQRRIQQFREETRARFEKGRQEVVGHHDVAHAHHDNHEIVFEMASPGEDQALPSGVAEGKVLPLFPHQKVSYRVDDGRDIEQIRNNVDVNVSADLDRKTVWAVQPLEHGPQMTEESERPVAQPVQIEAEKPAAAEAEEPFRFDAPLPDGQGLALKLKPLDFSHVPPPPPLVTLPSDRRFQPFDPSVFSHSQYKMVFRQGLP
ncbi:putative histone lysine methyltransferase, SET [Toxoplasma gondii GAB2-2007-GAL-DOM2]|uniref:Putative histone lysine methyltransferase, SET n=2 Tax=Toxoplasma gondii TaxID=5811 RepID=A0A086KQZ5_TOXGO|nr:putative histone lysine methyltransferase, SET [Toxoplasma gondii GAB2-2007-GAL-DOM2]KFG46813.1 putative histone lysine methyltransferase, SET [Toxoplasma gondii FOU]